MGKTVLCSDKTSIYLFDLQEKGYVWWKSSSVRHIIHSIMVWGCFTWITSQLIVKWIELATWQSWRKICYQRNKTELEVPQTSHSDFLQYLNISKWLFFIFFLQLWATLFQIEKLNCFKLHLIFGLLNSEKLKPFNRHRIVCVIHSHVSVQFPLFCRSFWCR